MLPIRTEDRNDNHRALIVARISPHVVTPSRGTSSSYRLDRISSSIYLPIYSPSQRYYYHRMPRKGSSKVRTGCLTCKCVNRRCNGPPNRSPCLYVPRKTDTHLRVRKVKCDEGKPQCQRCVGTGRRCDGYAPATSSSNLSLHRPRHLFSNVDDVGEKRALQFFCQVAGPFLSGPMDPYFWTHLVMQFSTFEPAVRHTVVAISSLYEQMHSSSPGSGKVRADDRLALRHYNSAIRHLKLMRNEPLVLLVCVLFVCIEFLLGNREAAIQHCKHGVTLLQNVEASYPWTREYISPIFRRLTMFPFFFGVGRMSFPDLLGLDDQIPGSFVSFQDAQYYIDGIVTRTVRLVRWGDDYRLGNKRQSPVPLELLLEQERIRTLLNEVCNIVDAPPPFFFYKKGKRKRKREKGPHNRTCYRRFKSYRS